MVAAKPGEAYGPFFQSKVSMCCHEGWGLEEWGAGGRGSLKWM